MMSALTQGLRRVAAIARATALEILSEPLSLLLLLTGLVIATLAPAFHYHQFGEASRMARDAGLSSLFLCGTLFAVFGVLRSFRREVESGTLQMALAHPVSRRAFFLSKVLGAALAQLVFAVTVASTAVTIVNGAEIGGLVAAKSGDVARLWGPSLALGLSAIVVPLAVGAVLNRFFRFRFVLTSFVLSTAVALAGTAYAFHWEVAGRLLPVLVLLTAWSLVFLAASAAMSVRFRAHVAASAVGVLAVVSVPVVGNYYLSDALAKGGRVEWSYVGLASAVLVPAVTAFLLLGLRFFRAGDIGDGN